MQSNKCDSKSHIFPACYETYDGNIWLMQSPTEGTCLYLAGISTHFVGKHRNWGSDQMRYFKPEPYSGCLTFSN